MVVQSQFIEMFDRCSESFKKYPISDLCHSSNDIKCGPFGTQLKQAEYTDLGIPVWGIPQINSGFTLAPDVFVSEEKARQLEQFSLVSEDIAMSRKGNVGQCALYPDSFEDGIIASDVVRIRVNKEMILPHFLVYQLHNSHQIRKQILEVSDGTVMAGINVTKMKGIIVYCPSISSQQKFKTILGQADKSKFDGLKSQFIEMSKHGCSKRQLGGLFCSIRNGANIKQGGKSGGFPITRIETIAEGYVDRSKMGYAGIEDNSYSGYYLQNYDILMSHINSMKHIGKTAIYRQSIGETVIHGMNLLCLRLKEGVANPMYVLYLLQSDDIRTEIRLISKQAVNQASFTVSDLKTIEITLPSMSVQNQFEVVVNQADKSKYLS